MFIQAGTKLAMFFGNLLILMNESVFCLLNVGDCLVPDKEKETWSIK